jgi:hypothetical protein
MLLLWEEQEEERGQEGEWCWRAVKVGGGTRVGICARGRILLLHNGVSTVKCESTRTHACAHILTLSRAHACAHTCKRGRSHVQIVLAQADASTQCMQDSYM